MMMLSYLATLIPLAIAATAPAGSISSEPFGKTKRGARVEIFTLTNTRGSSARIMTYGGTVVSLKVPDRNGRLGDVVLGFDSLPSYEAKSPYFGALIGRVGNRIAKGKFTLDGKQYSVPVNNGPNSLHGGLIGYDKRVWRASPRMTRLGPSLRLSLRDKNGDQGYPGNVDVQVTYTLTNANTLRIVYRAKTDHDTPFNPTNHTYFNLKDAGKSDVLGHVMELEADSYTPVDDTLIPTGEIAPVAGTPIDFRMPKPIGKDIEAMGGSPAGYDHNLVLRGGGGHLAKAAVITEPTTGRHMEVWTTEPGVQFYSGNFLDGTITGKGGAVYQIHHAFCLEAQHFPDSINHPKFPSTVLHPGETYHQVTEYRFPVRR